MISIRPHNINQAVLSPEISAANLLADNQPNDFRNADSSKP